MERIPTGTARPLWIGRISNPSKFSFRSAGEYALLLVEMEGRLSPDEQAGG